VINFDCFGNKYRVSKDGKVLEVWENFEWVKTVNMRAKNRAAELLESLRDNLVRGLR